MQKSLLLLVLVAGCGGGGTVSSVSNERSPLMNPGALAVAVNDQGVAVGQSWVDVPGFSGVAPVVWDGSNSPTLLGLVPGRSTHTHDVWTSNRTATAIAGRVLAGPSTAVLWCWTGGSYILFPEVDTTAVPLIVMDSEPLILGDSSDGYFLWNYVTGSVVREHEPTDLLPDSIVVPMISVVGAAAGPRVWDGSNGEISLTGFIGHEDRAKAVCSSPDGEWIGGSAVTWSQVIPGLEITIPTVWNHERAPAKVYEDLVGYEVTFIANNGRIVVFNGPEGQFISFDWAMPVHVSATEFAGLTIKSVSTSGTWLIASDGFETFVIEL